MIWNTRQLISTMGTLLLVVVFLACSADSKGSRVAKEVGLEPRPFTTHIDGKWIGNAVCYGPYRDGQSPGGLAPSAGELREDLDLMLPHWNLLRVYGALGPSETLLEAIRAAGLNMKVVLGAWIAPDSPEANRQEVDAAIRLANEYPEVVLAVSVGNETQIHWSTHKSPVDSLIEHVRRVRASVSIPVTVADDFNFWNKPESQILAAEIDFITMHAHPMWNGLQAEFAMDWLKDQIQIVETLHLDVPIVIGETGWATSVADEGEQARLIKGKPGEAEQKRFYDSLRAWADSTRRTAFVFEAFDENWKGGSNPEEVEKHWGLFKANRSPKAALH
jgi:exo-beta-1,3-glucanase (GH17 family)